MDSIKQAENAAAWAAAMAQAEELTEIISTARAIVHVDNSDHELVVSLSDQTCLIPTRYIPLGEVAASHDWQIALPYSQWVERCDAMYRAAMEQSRLRSFVIDWCRERIQRRAWMPYVSIGGYILVDKEPKFCGLPRDPMEICRLAGCCEHDLGSGRDV